MLFIRGTGPIGYPGGAEVVNMQPPAALHQEGRPRAALHRRRPAVGHVRLALDPQRLAGSGGGRRPRAAADRRPRAHRPEQAHGQHPDLRRGARARAAPPAEARRLSPIPKSQTPWQEIQRAMVDQFDEGMVLRPAVEFHDVAHTLPVPRDNHYLRRAVIARSETTKQSIPESWGRENRSRRFRRWIASLCSQ